MQYSLILWLIAYLAIESKPFLTQHNVLHDQQDELQDPSERTAQTEDYKNRKVTSNNAKLNLQSSSIYSESKIQQSQRMLPGSRDDSKKYLIHSPPDLNQIRYLQSDNDNDGNSDDNNAQNGKQGDHDKMTVIIIIVSIITGSILILLLLVCLCISSIRTFCCRFECCGWKDSNCNANTILKKQIQRQLSPEFKKDWIKSQNLVLKSKESICCICLEESANLMTKCSHKYHKKCMMNGLKYSSDCSICRKVVFGEMKVYCQQCLGYYYIIQVKTCIDDELPESTTKDVCQQCQQIKL